MEKITCSKCDTPPSDLGHLYCATCGARYSHTPFNIQECLDSSLYQQLCEMHNAFNGPGDRSSYDLMSEASARMLYEFAYDAMPYTLTQYFVGDAETTQKIHECREDLGKFFWLFVLDGYFARLAERRSRNDEPRLSEAEWSEEGASECRQLIVKKYSEYQDAFLEGTGKEITGVMYTFVLSQARDFFDGSKELQTLESIYMHLQATCHEAIFAGYGTALWDEQNQKATV